MPDKTWKGAGTCSLTFKDGDKLYESWEEDSHLKEYTFKITGGTGRQGASGLRQHLCYSRAAGQEKPYVQDGIRRAGEAVLAM